MRNDSSKSAFTVISAFTAGFILCTPVAACEPIPHFMFVVSGPQAWTAWALQSVLALVLIVIFKGILFYYKSKLPFVRAMGLMVIANIVSTIPGVLGAFAWTGGALSLVTAPVVLGLIYYFPARSLKRHPKLQHFHASIVVFFLVVLTIISTLTNKFISN